MNINPVQTLQDTITLVRASERDRLVWENAFLHRLLKLAEAGDWPPRVFPFAREVKGQLSAVSGQRSGKIPQLSNSLIH